MVASARTRALPTPVVSRSVSSRSDPGNRGSGVGAALITAAEQLVRSGGHIQACLGVAADNPDAARLYHRLGYRPTGVRDQIAYTWYDEDGAPHNETQDNELLVERLAASVDG